MLNPNRAETLPFIRSYVIDADLVQKDAEVKIEGGKVTISKGEETASVMLIGFESFTAAFLNIVKSVPREVLLNLPESVRSNLYRHAYETQDESLALIISALDRDQNEGAVGLNMARRRINPKQAHRSIAKKR